MPVYNAYCRICHYKAAFLIGIYQQTHRIYVIHEDDDLKLSFTLAVTTFEMIFVNSSRICHAYE